MRFVVVRHCLLNGDEEEGGRAKRKERKGEGKKEGKVERTKVKQRERLGARRERSVRKS